jgi:hypothetical protein
VTADPAAWGLRIAGEARGARLYGILDGIEPVGKN